MKPNNVTQEKITELSRETERLWEKGQLDRETFRDLLRQGLELTDSFDDLHGILSPAPRAWYEDFLPR
jgi:hypothetical protein